MLSVMLRLPENGQRKRKVHRRGARRKRAPSTGQNGVGLPQHCSLCGESGHKSAGCPQRVSPLTGTVVCFACGEPGHVHTNCPVRRRPSRLQCQLCGQRGHTHHVCTHNPRAPQEWTRRWRIAVTKLNKSRPPITEETRRKRAAANRAFYCEHPSHRHKRCSVCGQLGHHSTTCPSLGRASGSFSGMTRCSACGNLGHNSRTCPTLGRHKVKLPAGSRRCTACGDRGHNSRTCPTLGRHKVKLRTGSRCCTACGARGHNSRTCPTLSRHSGQHSTGDAASASVRRQPHSGIAQASGQSRPAEPTITSRVPRCSVCHATGHYKSACHQKPLAMRPLACHAGNANDITSSEAATMSKSERARTAQSGQE
jgi:Zinc knuckle